MRYLYLLVAFLFLGLSQSIAQTSENCSCCSSAHQQFDFWLGDWEVFDSQGNKIGENLIEKLENNCLITETWKAGNGSSGRSMNYYDTADETWNQLWVSSNGNILKLKGKGEPGKMILKSKLAQGKKGNYYNQITWSLNKDGSVTQYWEILDENGNFLSEAFKGIYRKKDSPTEN